MAFKVFISHSVGPRELAIIYALAEEAAKRGITPFIPDRMWNPQERLPQRISQAIKECDAMLVLGTKFGQHIDWLLKEEREAIPQGKKAVFILDPEVPSLAETVLRVNIDRFDLRSTIQQATQQLELLRLAKEQSDALTWLIVGGLLFLLFSEGK